MFNSFQLNYFPCLYLLFINVNWFIFSTMLIDNKISAGHLNFHMAGMFVIKFIKVFIEDKSVAFIFHSFIIPTLQLGVSFDPPPPLRLG